MASFLSDAKARLQHNNMLSLAPKDIKNLAEIISTEKAVITSSSRLSTDYRKAADALKEWGMGEGDDLADVLPKLAILLGHLADAQSRFSDHDGTYRIHFKSVRMREENLATMKKNKDTLQGKIATLEKKITKMSSENKDLPTLTTRLQDFRAELVILDHSVLTEEARLSDFKRDTVREGLGLRLGAMLELAEKMTIICELGKMLVAEVPTDKMPLGGVRSPYQGAAKTQSILDEAQRCLTEVIFNPCPGGIITNTEADENVQTSSPELNRPSTSSQPPQSMQSDSKASGLPAGDHKYLSDGNLPPYHSESRHVDQAAYSSFDTQLSSSALPYAQEPSLPPKRAYSPPPRLELSHTPRGSHSAVRTDDPDPIAAAAARLRNNYDDSFYIRGSDGIPRSTGPGNPPTETRPAPEPSYGLSSSESDSTTLPTQATHSHESASRMEPASAPSPRVPVHRPSNPSMSGSGSGWQEPRTTNAGAFRRAGGMNGAHTPTRTEYESAESRVAVPPLNVNKRASKLENGYSTPERSMSHATPTNSLPPSSAHSAGFAQNRYVTNLD
ncbi:hypothetical protein CROQUDRAFT_649787 [Cronartium quercuum f. sp. fusiforme G11]|uniref:Eisosome component PIL1-domain-containing protein n=1 Tax=Cronartium quercuum f. sp. fusiforme G11 TaxID=708437 RepID=A0A9P6NS26_9BASI|nr:hypothetical protein CROQUDRAFT_649787 [Cronartium quercuum f. sp. fusiforme G11]